MALKNVKAVFIGDGGVGKTSLLITHTQGIFPADYVEQFLITMVHKSLPIVMEHPDL